MEILIVILIIGVVIGLYVVSVYNKLVRLKTQVQEGSADIDAQLKRRYDLIPNLVETVKGIKNFEASTMEAVVKARQQAVNISGLTTEKAAAEGQLNSALGRLFAVAESYPDLKSSQNFLQLQQELTNTEDRILSARRFYNTVVSDYNAYQISFPALLFKATAGAQPADFFEVKSEEEKEPVKVNFN
jgi:LemA protein